MLATLGRTCYRHRWIVAAVWLVAVVGGAAFGSRVFERLGVDYGGTGIESFEGLSQIDEASQVGERLTGLVTGQPIGDPSLAESVRQAAAELSGTEGVTSVVTAYGAPEPLAATLRAPDGEASLVVVDLDRELSRDESDRTVDAVVSTLEQLDSEVDAEVLVGGELLVNRELQEQSEEDLRRGELVALPIVLLVMIVVFGGIVVAGLPLLAAFGAIAGALATLYGASYLVDLDPGVPSVATVLGLGLSIDYALLLVSRYREERGRGLATEPAVVVTMSTAGRTITFSALTVAVSLSGLFLFDLAVFHGLAIAGASAVLFALLAGLTLVPALLGLLHRRISAPSEPVPDDGRFARLARATQRRPWLVTLGVAAVLLLAGTPFLRAEFQNGTTDLLPRDSAAREYAEALGQHFPDRATEPVLVVARADAGALAPYAQTLSADPEVDRLAAEVGQPRQLGPGYAVVEVVPEGDAQGDGAQELVGVLRDLRPDAESWVTGQAAVLVDFKTVIVDALPWAVAWLAGATFTLLFLMTGSLLVPLKALVMNTLSLGATFGALVWIFQDGHLSDLLGFVPVDGLETWVPVVTFAFAFGLSMDYEVFLLARVKELYDQGLSNDRAVELGLQRSGRIITSAALIVFVVCLGFATGELLSIKQLGVALAIAVAVDATLVRTLLVPATMTLLGDRNWWAPAPLRRFHTRFGLHESPQAADGDGRLREARFTQRHKPGGEEPPGRL